MKIKRYKKDKIFLLVLAILIILFLISLSKAESWACFTKSQKINFCNPKTPDRTCGSTSCVYCISDYIETDKCYNQGNFNICNSASPECTIFGDGSNIDSEKPVINIIDPKNSQVYTSKLIYIVIESNEMSKMSFFDNSDSRRISRICNNCITYEGKRSFKEGLNNITFVAEDVVGNIAHEILEFFIDSQIPRITKINPKKGLTSGMLKLEFKEENPISVLLKYGDNQTGIRTLNINFNELCILDRGSHKCNITANLGEYNNRSIFSWFEVRDIAGNIASSKPLTLDVDSQPPSINKLNYEVVGNKLILEIKITEENFGSIIYRDNYVSRPSWKSLCSRLNDNSECKKELTLNRGNHNIDLIVYDYAGNTASRNINLII